MSPRKSLSSASLSTHPAASLKGTRRHQRARKANSHTELTKSELEHLLFEAARMRAIKAHTGG